MTTCAIIPVRNRPGLIKKAITSIQLQSEMIEEIIIVDDGSTDTTPDVVESMRHADQRIKLIRILQSGGASKARNVGVNATQSEWVSFLDSDDEWLPQKHQSQMTVLAERPGAIASFTGLTYRWLSRRKDVIPPASISTTDLRRLNYLGSTSSATVRRSAFIEAGGFDETLPSCQDWDLWLRLSRLGQFAIVQKPLVIFNQNEAARISRDRRAVIDGHRIFFAKVLMEPHSRRDILDIQAHHHYCLAQIQLYNMDDPLSALTELSSSLVSSPNQKALQLIAPILRVIFRRIRSRLAPRER